MKRMGAVLAVALIAASIFSGCIVVPADGWYPRGYYRRRGYDPYYPYYPYYYPYPYYSPPAPVWVPGQWVWNGWQWVWQPGYWHY